MKMGYSITLIIGVIIFVISIVKFRQTLDFIKMGSRTTATVIYLERIYNIEGGDTYRPILKFKTFTDQEIIFKHNMTSSPASFSIGQQVSIVYDSNNPANAIVLSYFALFFWSIVFMAISMPLIVIGGGYFFTLQYLK